MKWRAGSSRATRSRRTWGGEAEDVFGGEEEDECFGGDQFEEDEFVFEGCEEVFGGNLRDAGR